MFHAVPRLSSEKAQLEKMGVVVLWSAFVLQTKINLTSSRGFRCACSLGSIRGHNSSSPPHMKSTVKVDLLLILTPTALVLYIGFPQKSYKLHDKLSYQIKYFMNDYLKACLKEVL